MEEVDIKNKEIIIEDTSGDEIMHLTISEQGVIIGMVNGEVADTDDDTIRIQQIDNYFV